MANKRISVISNEIFRGYLEAEEFLKLSYPYSTYPSTQLWVHLLRILMKLRGL